MSGVLLQLIMVAANPQRVGVAQLRECFRRDRHEVAERFCPRTLGEYCARFNGWYLRVAQHVHNTELL